MPDAAALPEGALLRVEGLEKRFRRRKVVKGVSLHVHAGEIVGLLGKNGAGKTTTFRMVVGLIPPDAGRVTLAPAGPDGGPARDLARMPMYRRARAGLGYLPQEASVFRALSVRQNILAILEARGVGRRERRERTAALVEEFGLARVADSRAETLSGGERRRLEIARALSLEPRVLMLDEPFSGVDPIAVADIQEIIAELAERDIGILLTDHNVHDTLRITDRAYIMDDGRIMTQGTPAQIVHDPTAREHYLGERFHMDIEGAEGTAPGAAPGAAPDGAADDEDEDGDDDDEQVPVVLTD